MHFRLCDPTQARNGWIPSALVNIKTEVRINRLDIGLVNTAELSPSPIDLHISS
jgi:hypothetical protein